MRNGAREWRRELEEPQGLGGLRIIQYAGIIGLLALMAALIALFVLSKK
jgi:hypothetical protein